MKKRIWIIPLVLCIISLIILFRPAGRITFDKSVSKNRILFQYEIFGCGSLVRKVIDGGEQIVANYIGEYPDVGMNEIVFTDDSDEPKAHMDTANFHTAGLAEKYTFIVEGTPVGVAKGVYECSDLKSAYNENVVEFKVNKWYFTSYVPYAAIGDVLVILITFANLFIGVIWIIILIMIGLYRFAKSKVTSI